MRLPRLVFVCLAAIFLAAPLTGFATGPAAAQSNPFAPVVLVNNKAITGFEIEQRALLLQALSSPGDVEKEARIRLIEDRVRLEEAARRDIKVTPEQITQGMTEFAARGQLSMEDFITAIGQRGVSPETFRDFVEAGIAWREVVRTKFAGQISITEAEIDRALSLEAQRGELQVLISELVLAGGPEEAEQSLALARELSASIRGEDDFVAAVGEYSLSPTRDRGGQLDWMPLSNLPGPIAGMLQRMKPGQVSAPIQVPNAVALFLLRGVQETGRPGPDRSLLDFAQFRIPAGRSPEARAEAARLRAAAPTCDELFPLAKGLPADRLVRETLLLPQVPRDLALELAKLDPQESTTLLRGDTLVLLMLCNRTLQFDAPPTRDQVRDRLINDRVGRQAEIFLARLVAEADIRSP